MPGRWGRWWVERSRSWWSIIRMVPVAGRVAPAAVVLNLVIGVLPLGFVVGTSVAIERVAAAGRPLRAGGGWGGVLVAVVLAVASLLLQSVLSPFQAAFTELISRRVDGVCARRLMRATLADAPVALLEQPEMLDKLGDARRGLVEYFVTPGAAVAGLIALIARYVQLAGAVVIVGVALGPLAGFVIAVVALIARFGQRGSLARWSVIIERMSAARRKAWWRARADRDSDAFLRPLWRERRRVFLAPFVVFSLAVLAGAAAVLVMLADTADRGGLSVLSLSLAIQAILIPLRFGVFFPEADVQTQYGMLAHDSILQIERNAAAGAGRLRHGQRPAGEIPASGIRFEGVSFTYPGSDRRVLDEVELDFPTGTSTAIVGLNGADKTTLVKLLARLYEPVGGRIRVDGTDLSEFDVRSWQRRLAVIYQDYVRYELDAAANIGLGAPERMGNLTALERACEWAGASRNAALTASSWPSAGSMPSSSPSRLARTTEPARAGRIWSRRAGPCRSGEFMAVKVPPSSSRPTSAWSPALPREPGPGCAPGARRSARRP